MDFDELLDGIPTEVKDKLSDTAKANIYFTYCKAAADAWKETAEYFKYLERTGKLQQWNLKRDTRQTKPPKF